MRMAWRVVGFHSTPWHQRLFVVFQIAFLLVSFSYVDGKDAETLFRPLRSFRAITSRTAYACENNNLVLECRRGEVIRIIRANYGRFTVKKCNEFGLTEGLNLQCRYQKSKEIISERCDGRQSCKMMVNNHIFADPCPNTSKYAEVKYNCQRELRNDTTSITNVNPGPDITRKKMEEKLPTDGAPEPPVITMANSISPTEVSVYWKQTQSEIPIITTVAFYGDREISQEYSTFYSSGESPLIIENLRPNTTYQIHLKSYNSQGPSAKSNTVVVTTRSFATTTTTTTTTTMPTELFTPSPPQTTTTTTTTDTDQPMAPVTAKPQQPNKQKENGHRRICNQINREEVVWPRTQYGATAKRRCPKPLIGVSTWVCLHYGWDKNGPDFSQCISQRLQDLIESDKDADEVTDLLSKLASEKEMSAGDLSQTATKLLPDLCRGMMHAKFKSQRKRRLKKFKKALMKTGSSLLSPKQARAWRVLSNRERSMAATSMMVTVEDTGYQTAAVMSLGSSDVTIDDNIVMGVNVLSEQQLQDDIQFPNHSDMSNSPWKSVRDSIIIPSSSLRMANRKGRVDVVFTIYKNMADLVQPENGPTSSPNEYNTDTTIIDGSNGANGNSPKEVINSNIISASINSKSHWSLPDPVRFTLQHLQETNHANPKCSFWDMDENTLRGSWSQEGCQTVHSNSTHTVCQCNHLTNFAVLMDVSGEKMSEDHELALRLITYVGCIVSVVCLFVSWITFTAFKNLQCDRNTVHKNLVLVLMLAEIIFLAGIAQTQIKLLCSIIAGLLHYFFLAAFAWMCLEGVQLYVMLVEVFELERSRVHWYYLFGYGVPLIIVATSAGIKHEGYGTDKHCWLSFENYFIWSFIGPALAVILINLGMLSIAICTMCRHSNISATQKERSKISKFNVSESYSSMETFAPVKLRFPELPAWVKGAFVLVVLLGLTWILGVFYLNRESLVMAYAFTILNSLQGLFIFVFHCLMNEKVQKEYRKFARRTSWLPNCIRVNYGGYTGVSSSPNVSSGSGNYLSRLFRPNRRKQSASSTHSSMKPFLNTDQHRRSDATDHSSSRDSTTIPSSLNGYVYTPHYNGGNNHHLHSFFPCNNNGSLHKPVMNGLYPLEPCYETIGEGMAGDLSECIDCSMVDSEMVSEYCKNNMQVRHEQRRYSTGSENSGYEVPRDLLELPVSSPKGPDELSNLSSACSSKKPMSTFTSNSDVNTAYYDLDGSDEDEGEEEEDEKSLGLHLDKYIIPQKNDFPFPQDHKSSSMNKLSKTVNPFNTNIPGGESPSSGHHSSSPNIEVKPGIPSLHYDPSSSPNCNPIPTSFPVIHPSTTHQRPSMSSSSSGVSSPSSIKSSLPNLITQANGEHYTDDDNHQKTPPKARPSSDADLPFSPFRFSKTEC